jgi:hypothetical protein
VNEDYADVELSHKSPANSHFYLETSSPSRIFTNGALLMVCTLAHLAVAFRAPSSFGFKEKAFNINQTDKVSSCEIELILSAMRDYHRFIAVIGSIVARNSDSERTLDVSVTQHTTTFNNSIAQKIGGEITFKAHVNFTSGCNRSSTFPVIITPVSQFDEYKLRLTVKADWTGINGIYLGWTFYNPGADKCAQTAGFIVSILMGYMVMVYCCTLKFEDESSTQIYLILIGVTGVFSSNPIRYLLASSGDPGIWDCILISVFVAVFRTFLLLQLEILRGRNTAPNTILTLILASTFLFYAILDATARYDRQNHVVESGSETALILQSENALMIFESGVFCISILYMILAVFGNRWANGRRLWFFGILAGITGSVSLFCNAFCVFNNVHMFDVFRSMLVTAVYGGLASSTIFFLHCGAEPEYSDLNTRQNPKSFDVEEASVGLEEEEMDQE